MTYVERQNAFSLRLGKRQGCLLSPLLRNTVLQMLVSKKGERADSTSILKGRYIAVIIHRKHGANAENTKKST